MADTSGFDRASGENRELAAEVRARVEAAVRPETPTSGHVDDVARLIPLAPISRRSILRFLAAGSFAGSLSGDSYEPFEASQRTTIQSQEAFRVGKEYALKLVPYDYSDPVFDHPAGKDASLGEQALFNSNHFLRRGYFHEFASNTYLLERALEASHDPVAKASILQRLVIDNNYLGHGRGAALGFATQLAGMDFTRVPAPQRRKLVSLSADVISTATLNSMDSIEFKNFSAVDFSLLQRLFHLLEIDTEQSKEKMLTSALTGTRAGIYSIIQVKWMKRISEAVRLAPQTHNISTLRREWFDEVLFVSNKIEHDQAASAEMSEDFFYTICRITFHAFACGDNEHTRMLLSIYFDGSSKLRPHLADARPKIMKRLSANVQWIRLLQIAYALRNMDPGASRLYQLLSEDFTHIRKPANVAIHRAFLELGNNFHRPYSILKEGGIVEAYLPASPVDNQLPYYHLVVPAEI